MDDFDTFRVLIDYYSNGLIDLGYIILFAAAFPIGPLVAIIANPFEIRLKINVLLNIYKRPTCHRCAGISLWLYFWEVMSFISVVINNKFSFFLNIFFKIFIFKYFFNKFFYYIFLIC